MQKTPVSILQELMVKKGCVPNYELIHDGGGTHENTFTYKVSCPGLSSIGIILSATGTGRCKKDAKHLAAKNMLDEIAKQNAYLPLPASPAESPVRTPLPKPMPQPHIHSPNEPFINAIGELKDMCAENELPEPVYLTVSDVGPPHARVFTIHCVLSTFIEEGIGTTKKHAKHLAARKMYERVKEIISQSKSSFAMASAAEENNLQSSCSKNEIDCVKGSDIVNLYNKLTHCPKTDLGVKVADYYKKISTAYSLELRQKVTQNLLQLKLDLTSWQVEDVESLEKKGLERLGEILEIINLSVKRLIFSLENDKMMMAIYVNTVPEIVEVAIHEDKAELVKYAISRVVKTLQTLLL